MTDSKVSEAVGRCLNSIAIAQQNIAALQNILYRMDRQAKDDKTVQDAVRVINGELYRQLADAYAQLGWFAPISKEAMNILAERTRTWFQRDDTAIMHWLGESGSYHEEDMIQFRREVMSLFGTDKSDDD